MNYESLFTEGIDAFVDNAFQPQRTIFYAHIPKCSGTSSVEALKAACEHSWHFEFDKIDEMWDRFIQRISNPKLPVLGLAAGHFWHWHLHKLKQSEVPHHAVTFLRHPLDRLVSEYRYMCTPAHPPSAAFREECPTFGDFIEKKVHDNSIAWMLFGGVGSIAEYERKLAETFRFIGISEFYHMSMAILMESIGQQYEVAPRMNVTPSIPENRIEISDATQQRLMETQHMDIAIFERLHAKFARIADTFIGRELARSRTTEPSTQEAMPHPATALHEDT